MGERADMTIEEVANEISRLCVEVARTTRDTEHAAAVLARVEGQRKKAHGEHNAAVVRLAEMAKALAAEMASARPAAGGTC